jgi:hypothetical protein
MRGALRLILLVGILVIGSAQSQAQGLDIFGIEGFPLTAKDFAAMAAAADPLLNDESLPLGTTREWRNPASGDRGRITLLERFQYDYEGSTLPCRKLKYHTVFKNQANPYNLIIQRCRIANGRWKLL